MAEAATSGGESGPAGRSPNNAPQHMTMRARRRREEAVRRLVAEVQAQETTGAAGAAQAAANLEKIRGETSKKAAAAAAAADDGALLLHPETHDWLVASVTATALEKGLDRDLHAALVQEAKSNAGRIGQICQDHADVFLDSVAQVAALSHPSDSLSTGLRQAQDALQADTAGPMLQAAELHSQATAAWQRAQTLQAIVLACQKTALQLEKGRKQAAAGRPRAALQAVHQARTQLSRPMASLTKQQQETNFLLDDSFDKDSKDGAPGTGAPLVFALSAADAKKSLLETPFGKRASALLPKIENEVLMGARRNLNKWFLNLRSGGNSAKAGRSVLRQCAFSLAVGPGHLSLGGQFPTAYLWRAKIGDNLLVRVHLSGKVARALRQGYWLDRDANSEADRIATTTAPVEGLPRKAEALAAAFGWYRCWEPGEEVVIDPAEIVTDAEASAQTRGGSSTHGPGTGSRHGVDRSLSGSSHGLRGSKHGPSGTASSKRSLGFRASTSSKSQAFQDISSTLGSMGAKNKQEQQRESRWNQVLHPTILYEKTANRKAEDAILLGLPESVAPVRRAELAFSLLGRADEFVQYYEQNRFGETKVGGEASAPGSGGGGTASGGGSGGGGGERKSYLSSLTGDDVTLGNDAIFFSKTLPHLCASVAGFSAVEAALELGNFEQDEDDDHHHRGTAAGATGGASSGGAANSGSGGGASHHHHAGGTSSSSNKPASSKDASSASNAPTAASSSRFRESSERYERSLVTELGSVVRSRCRGATLPYLVRASHLLAALRASLKIVHPSSGARRYDKDALSLGKDIFVDFMKVATEEQMRATALIVADDSKIPVTCDVFSKKGGVGGGGVGGFLGSSGLTTPASLMTGKNIGVPDPEEVGLPFGLDQMKQKPPDASSGAGKDPLTSSRSTYSRALPVDEAYTFSQSVPIVLRLLHSRAIATAAFAMNQQELGQVFPHKDKCSDAAGFVLDCIEQCVHVAAKAMKDSDHTVDEGSVDKAVQVMANITALQHCLPRFFATLVRGMCHVGLMKADELDETLRYAEKTLKNANKACDAEIGSTYSLVYEICRNRIDSHINFALENFNWVAKSVRHRPNAYIEGLTGYLKSVFNSLGPMDEGSRAGLHFSCCGHVSERLVKLFSGKAGDTTTMDNSGIQPMTRIDAFGIKNLSTDCGELENFADSTNVPQLRDCFSELRTLTNFLLDKELPQLILQDNAAARRRKYPILSLEKVGNILEKYVGTGLGDKLMGGGAASQADNMLLIDKKELPSLIKIVRAQQFS